MKKRTKTLYAVLAALILCAGLGGGCNTPPDKKYLKDGKQFGVVKGLFRERWWNFYERGVSYLQGGFSQEAIADLKEALSQRDRDQRRARTYGMHFVDYFPHRELGAAYYHSGNYEEALKELELSLSMVESGRAKYYMNEVRRALLKTSQKDSAPPNINLSAGAGVTNRFKLKVEGIVEDDSYAHKIAINDDPLFIELAEKKLPFSKEIKLNKGVNEIKIKTSDLLGKVSEKTVEVIGDFEGPLLNIDNVVDGQEVTEDRVVLKGTVADDSGITTLKINDTVITYKKEREAAFTQTLHLTQGANKITLTATDVAGNTTSGELQLLRVSRLSRGKILFKDSPLHPAGTRQPIRLALYGDGLLDTGEHRLFAAATPEQPGSDFKLTLKELADKQTVFYETMYIDGSVTGADDITAVKINGSPLTIRPGKTIYFNQLIELKQGDNKLTLDVQDKKGATAAKTVTITYQAPAVKQIGSRMSVAILPFEVKGEASPASNTIYDSLVSAFLNQERFNIVSRGAELEAALRELKLSSTDLADKTKALQVGKMIAAESILMGTINETKNSIEIYARLINTETSGLMETRDVYGEDKGLAQVQFIVNGLALKFKHSFPLVEGIVIKAAGKDIYADFGIASRIKKDMKFIIFREGEVIVHPVTGKKLGSETKELGQARVINILEDMTIGKLVAEVTEGQQIQIKDRIITK